MMAQNGTEILLGAFTLERVVSYFVFSLLVQAAE